MTLFHRNKKLIFGFVVVGFLALAGFLYSGRKTETTSMMGTAEMGDLIQRVTIAGNIAPNRRTSIMAPYTGYVRKLFVKIGDRVKQNDPIASVAQSLLTTDPVFPLRAPFSGTVVQVGKTEGEYVRESDAKEFIVRIDDLDRLFVKANAAEIDRAKIKVDQEVVIKASAVLGRTYKGVIRELSLAAREEESWSRNQSQVEFPIRIEILDHDTQIKPGMSVVMDIITNRKADILLLKHEFLHKENDAFFVVLADDSRRTVEVGLQNEEAFEVLKGLNSGERVKQVDFASLLQNE